ncbi:MAG: DNA internalization-related competence protein ComEC/Rec2 [Pseudomonadota bacterium]
MSLPLPLPFALPSTAVLAPPWRVQAGWRWASAMVAWLAGVACQLQGAQLGPVWHDGVGGGLALACVAALWRFTASTARSTLALMGLCALLGALTAQGHARWRLAQTLPSSLENQDVRLTGVVASLPQRNPQGVSFVFEVDADSLPALRRPNPVDGGAAAADASQPPERLALGWYTAWGEEGSNRTLLPPVRAGERWALTVRLRRPHGLFNPHGFDRELHLFEQGVRATGSVRRGERLHEAAGHPVQRWRQRVRDRIEAAVPDPRAAGVLTALAVGDQGAIEPEDWSVFRAAGVAHLMSISGLHVTMFAWLAAGLIGWAWSRSVWAVGRCPAPWAARWGGCAAAAGYAVFSGGGVPAQRTVWMLLVVTVLYTSGRRWPWPWVLLAAAVVVTAVDPWALLQPGFWLSFTAVALLMLSSGAEAGEPVWDGPSSGRGAPSAPVSRWQAGAAALRRSLREGWRTQWVATGGLAPLSLVFFQQLSVVGLLANLVAIPVVTLVITPLALLGIVWPGWWTAGAWLVQQLGTGLGWLAAWPGAVWAAPVAPGWAQAAGLVAGVLWMAQVPWSLRALAVPLMLPLLWPPTLAPPEGAFEVLAADVGQGTAVLVQTRRHVLLFDAGPTYSRQSDAGQRVLLPLLHALGHTRIDRLMLSHRDADHVGGALALLRGLPVGSLWSSVEASHPVIVEAQALGVPLQRCDAGQAWQWDGVHFEVLHPPPADHARPLRPNAISCVVRVRNVDGHTSLLLAGDIEKAQEAALVRAHGAALASTVLMVPHHGSRTSSTAGFLDAVRPSVAVVQAGHHNRFGHPAPSVAQRYQDRGIALHGSPRCGAWRWHSNTPVQAATCERSLRRRYWHWQDAVKIGDDASLLSDP